MACQAESHAALVNGVRQTTFTGNGLTLRPDDVQGEKMPIVALQAGNQSGKEERGFAATGGAENDEQRLHSRGPHAAQGIEAADNLGVTAEIDGRILFFQRDQAAIRRSLRIIRRRPGEIARIQAGLFQPYAQAGEPLGEEFDLLGFFFVGKGDC